MARCKTCKQPVEPEPVEEIVTVEGISYTINHWPDGGRTVESPCDCFGGNRIHSTSYCPWMAKRFGKYPWKQPHKQDK